MHENDDPVFCPILQFLAIAFADQVFETADLQFIEQFRNVRIQPLFRCQIFRWKESIKNILVFRSPTGVAERVRTSSDRP